ncbi:molybdenum ABC transporter ATP-binding protein [Rhodalgimonas zhirmunskyi]|uniref:Molybdenum ABC transporter ATP-binding protein n=1 Tax=Rhodalgimonas zhirmunskyi TaxID=2964767 RepID=A0AAJ1U8Q4_9RHOB|nr:molybdenum ABC transporter ATP-binding protein [Rhodoalgimonas zhirmunskyi]MDQ2095024.1 molybdenum ABC transporter ATP-binding protein [Rhodoalgimonas zhirmunskyi]
MTLSIALTHRFADFTLDVAFDAPPGLTVLFGRSGSGKTTVVQAVAGLLTPLKGHIAIGEHTLLDTERGINLPAHRRRAGYVFQDARLFPHLTVQQNLTYARRFLRGRTPSTSLDEITDMLGIAPLLSRRPATLSGGEKARVALGRALLSEPDILLADEPLAALDAARKAEILPYFETLRDAGRIPILYVSHDMAEVARLATTLITLDAGRVTAQGPAADLLSDPAFHPAGPREAGALIEATIAAHESDGLTRLDAGGAPLFLPGLSQAPGTRLRLRIAAQDVMLARTRPTDSSALNILAGVVREIHQGDGPGAIVALDTQAGRVLARITKRSVAALDLAPGTACHAIVKSVAIAPESVAPGLAPGLSPGLMPTAKPFAPNA